MSSNIESCNYARLLGNITLLPKFDENKLSTKKQALILLFYNTRTLKKSLACSIIDTINDIIKH